VSQQKSVDNYGTQRKWVENGELMMADVLEGDCRDKTVDRL